MRFSKIVLFTVTLVGIGLIFYLFVSSTEPISTEPAKEPTQKEAIAKEASKEAEESLQSKKESSEITEKEEYILITAPVLRVRSQPTVKSEIVWKFRKGMLLKAEKIKETEKEIWYGAKIVWLGCTRYPERFPSSDTWWYFAQKYDNETLAEPIETKEMFSVFPETKPEDKWIKVTISQQKVEAYEKNKKVFSALISAGLKDSPTPLGVFRIFRKELSACMQGPMKEFGFTDEYDLPGIGWTMFFTSSGAALHGTYWHQDFGRPHSHGCVNLSNEDAQWLYWWAPEGTKVVVE